MDRIKRNKEYLIAPLAALAILFIVYMLKEVYPFGNGSIAFYDMGPQYIPEYTHAHEFLHGKAPLFFDWYNGASCDCLSNYTTYGLNPMNVFLFFVKRDDLFQFMGIFLALKLMLSALTMSAYMKKTYRCGAVMNVAFSLFYTYCGFMVQNYMNIFFMDIMILFPLLMLALKALLNEGKFLGYTVMTLLCFILNGYLSFMVYVFVIFYSFGHMFFISEDSAKCRRAAAQLGIFTLLSYIIAAYMMIPGTLKLLDSPRAGYNKTLDEILFTRTGDFDYQKRFMLFGCEAGIAALLAHIIRSKKDGKKLDKQSIFFVYLLVVLMIPVFCEGSNLLWHGGSYVHFPYRFGFILAFVCCDIAAYFASLRGEKPLFKVEKKKLKSVLEYASLITAAASAIIITVMAIQMKDTGIEDKETYVLHKYIFIASTASCFILFGFCEKKFRTVLLVSIAAVQALLGSYALVAPDAEGALSLSYTAKDIRQSADMEDRKLSRFKMLNMMDTNVNLPLLSGVPGISDWTLNISKNYLEEMRALGYDSNYTYTMDTGGTAFSDALLNVKKVYSHIESANSLYTFSKDSKYFHIYDCNYTLPFGILAGDELTELDSRTHESPFSYQNRIYKALSGDSEDLFTTFTYMDIVTADDNEMNGNMFMPYRYSGEFNVDKESAVYIYTSSKSDIFALNVNGEPASLPYENEDDNVYPRSNLTGCAFLGIFSGEKVSISVNSKNKHTDKLLIGVMDLEKLDKLCKSASEAHHAYDVEAGGYKLSLKVDDPQGRYVFLPIEYNKNWRAEVNGTKTEITPVLGGAFTAIKLGSEDAEIKMRFVPYSFWISVVISIAGLILFAVVMLLRKKGMDICGVKAFNGFAYVCFYAVSIGALIILCAAPILGNILSLFVK